jgi:hypothetical protein
MENAKLTTKFKKAAFALFCKAHNLKSVGFSMIKRVYPKFIASSPVHWFTLIDKCELILQQQDAVQAKQDKLEKAKTISGVFAAYREVKVSEPDWLLGVSSKIYVHNLFIGTVGYCESRQSWYFSSRRNMQCVQSVNDAAKLVFARCDVF